MAMTKKAREIEKAISTLAKHKLFGLAFAADMKRKHVEKPVKVTVPEAGHIKFYVTCDRLCMYTTIGADNQHHASNKATKLFGPHWSQLRVDGYFNKDYDYKSPALFRELITTLPI